MILPDSKRIYQFSDSYTNIYVKGKLVAEGNRDPLTRIKTLPIDLTGKTVLDLGCNCGGMLYSVHEKVKHGIGFDINEQAIKNANTIKSDYSINNLEFHVRDLERHIDFDIPKTDVTFMLSISRWVTTWKEVLERVSSDVLIFEAHSKAKSNEAQEQIDFVKTVYPNVQHLLTAKEIKNVRSLYYCTR